MKQKLKIYRSLLILIVVIIFTIILYYFRYFYLASTILIVYLAFKEYLNIENEIQNEKMNTLTDEIKANINDNIYGALYAPTGGIVGPFEYTIALVENGVKNGGEVKLNSEVVSITKDDVFTIKLKNNEEIRTKYVINAAGVYADKIHNMICEESFKITPIRGEYYVLDKDEGKNFNNTIFQCPSKLGKGT